MFGANTIVGKKTFEQAPEGKLLVTSIFYTLQGEGPYAGRPAVFVRLAYCNLACSFCDTFFDAGDWMSFAEIQTKAEELVYAAAAWPTSAPRLGLVITGGEPMLQKNLSDFLRSVGKLYAWSQIESNGTLSLDLPELTTLVVSPKCAERDAVPLKYITPTAAMLGRADCLKFVMSALPFSPYREVPVWAHDWALQTGKPIYISPMNIYNDLPAQAKAMRWVGKEAAVVPDLHMRSTVDEVISFWEPGLLNMQANEANHKYAAAYCIKHGYRFNLQLHLYAGIA